MLSMGEPSRSGDGARTPTEPSPAKVAKNHVLSSNATEEETGRETAGGSGVTEEVKVAKRLLDSVARIIIQCVARSHVMSTPEFHVLIPLVR